MHGTLNSLGPLPSNPMDINSLQRIITVGTIIIAVGFALPSNASPIEVCIAMREAIAPENGATEIGKHVTTAPTQIAKDFQLRTPVTIGDVRVGTLLQLGNEKGSSVRAAFKFSDASAAIYFGQALAKQYGQSHLERSSSGTVFQVGLPEPFESSTTVVRGRNVHFFCAFN